MRYTNPRLLYFTLLYYYDCVHLICSYVWLGEINTVPIVLPPGGIWSLRNTNVYSVSVYWNSFGEKFIVISGNYSHCSFSVKLCLLCKLCWSATFLSFTDCNRRGVDWLIKLDHHEVRQVWQLVSRCVCQSYSFYRVMLHIARSMLSQGVCPSVCLSLRSTHAGTRIELKRLTISSNFFPLWRSHTILVFR